MGQRTLGDLNPMLRSQRQMKKQERGTGNVGKRELPIRVKQGGKELLSRCQLVTVVVADTALQ